MSKDKRKSVLASFGPPPEVDEEETPASDGVPKKFAVEFISSNGLRRWEYFPLEFSDESAARYHVLGTYDVREIVRCVTVSNYKELVETYAQR